MSTRQEEFVRGMLAWLNDEVTPKGVRVDADTPLFATRLLDSLRVLELIAFTEQAIGRAIPIRIFRGHGEDVCAAHELNVLLQSPAALDVVVGKAEYALISAATANDDYVI